MLRLAVIAALPEEYAAVRAAIPPAEMRNVMLLQGGVGWNPATLAAQKAAHAVPPPPLVVSTGFCGALTAGLNVGDVFVAETLLGPMRNLPYHCACPAHAALRTALAAHSGRVHHGGIVTEREPVRQPAAKRALGLERHALVVDLESYAIVSNIHQSKTRVLVLRTISDAVDDELPKEVGDFLDPHGKPRVGKLTQFVLKNPLRVKILLELKRRAEIAAAALTEAWKIALPSLLGS